MIIKSNNRFSTLSARACNGHSNAILSSPPETANAPVMVRRSRSPPWFVALMVCDGCSTIGLVSRLTGSWSGFTTSISTRSQDHRRMHSSLGSGSEAGIRRGIAELVRHDHRWPGKAALARESAWRIDGGSTISEMRRVEMRDGRIVWEYVSNG